MYVGGGTVCADGVPAAATRRQLLPLLALSLGCCASQPPPAVVFPDQIGDFVQDPQSTTRQSAAYTEGTDDPVTVTVRIGARPGGEQLVPALDLGGDDLTVAVADLGRGIKRFYPQAQLVIDEPLYLMRDGALQPGRHQTWQYQDKFLDNNRLVAMDVVISCCTDHGQLVSVWFRHRADHPIEGEMLGFLNAVPWS